MGEKKLSRAELFQTIVLAMKGEFPAFPDFQHKYHVIEPENGIRELLWENNRKEVQFCQPNGLAGDILKYCNETVKESNYLLTFKHAQEIAQMWMYSVQPIKMPKLFAFSEDNVLTFHRAPFESPEKCDDPPPLFADILMRSSNSDALAAFIGSIFFEESDRQQYLYIHGDGRNGKSALIEVLDLALGPGLHSEVTPEEGRPPNSHWTSTFLGKRLVVFTECESPRFPTSGIFKSLTGGDKTLINQKYKAAFSTRLNCKFIFLANNELMISSSKADQRRAIYCFIRENPEEIEGYSAKLIAEASQIIGYCMRRYLELCPGRQAILSEKSSSLLDLEQAHFFEHYFERNEKGLVALQAIQRLFKVEKIASNAEKGKFYDYVRLKYRMQKVCKGGEKHRVWFLEGAMLSKNADWATHGLNTKALKSVEQWIKEEAAAQFRGSAESSRNNGETIGETTPKP